MSDTETEGTERTPLDDRRAFLRRTAEVAAAGLFGVGALDGVVREVCRSLGELAGGRHVGDVAASIVGRLLPSTAALADEGCGAVAVGCGSEDDDNPGTRTPFTCSRVTPANEHECAAHHGTVFTCSTWYKHPAFTCGNYWGEFYWCKVQQNVYCKQAHIEGFDCTTEDAKYGVCNHEAVFTCPEMPYKCNDNGSGFICGDPNPVNPFFACFEGENFRSCVNSAFNCPADYRCNAEDARVEVFDCAPPSFTCDDGFNCDRTVTDFRCYAGAFECKGTNRFDCSSGHQFICYYQFSCGFGDTRVQCHGGHDAQLPDCNKGGQGLYKCQFPGQYDDTPGDFECRGVFQCPAGVANFKCEAEDDFQCGYAGTGADFCCLGYGQNDKFTCTRAHFGCGSATTGHDNPYFQCDGSEFSCDMFSAR